MACHPTLPQRIRQLAPTAHATKNSAPAGGHGWHAGIHFWVSCVPSSLYRRYGSCASSLRAPLHPTPVFTGAERTGPLLPFSVSKTRASRPRTQYFTSSTKILTHDPRIVLGVHARASDTRSKYPRQHEDCNPIADSTIVTASRGGG